MSSLGRVAVNTAWLGLALMCAALAVCHTAAADPAPTAWQPVVSDTSGAVGQFFTITQPASVTGVVSLLPTTGIPAPGTGSLTWDVTAATLSWRGGPPVSIDRQTSATYVLPESSGRASVIVTVTPGALPSADATDTLTVTGAAARAGLGDVSRDIGRAGGVFDGNLYIGLGDRHENSGEVWRSADGVNWVMAALPNFGRPAGDIHHVDSFIVFAGQLYAGTDTGEIWRTSDGSLWTMAAPSPSTDANNITSFAIFGPGGQLFANQAQNSTGARVFGSPDGSNWTNVFTFPEFQLHYAHDLQVFDGRLFSSTGTYGGTLGAGPGGIYSTADGENWQQSGLDGLGNPDNTDISGLAVFNGELYAGTFNATQGAEVWRTPDGSHWQPVATNGFGDPNNTIIHELTVFGNELYAGTEDDHEGGEIWRTSDGTDWSLANVPGFGTGKYQRMRAFIQFDGYLYASTGNDCRTNPLPGCQYRGWELWRLRAPPPVCSSITAVRRVGSGGYTGTHDQADMTVEAAGGLGSITNVEITNGTLSYSFTPGATEPVVVTATKATQGVPTAWSFDVTDQLGQTTHCG